MRERYWAFYLSLKHKSYYYKSFQILFKRINWAISSFLSLTTLSCIAAWDLWKNFQILWVILICISQFLISSAYPWIIPINLDMAVSKLSKASWFSLTAS